MFTAMKATINKSQVMRKAWEIFKATSTIESKKNRD